MGRLNRHEKYLKLAEAVSEAATCLRRRFGAVVVSKDDEVVGTGYCGAPRGVIDCLETKVCAREELKVPSGERYELCESVHAEPNAIMQAGRNRCIGGTLYLYCFNLKTGQEDYIFPCTLCERDIINAGIKEVVMRQHGGGYTAVLVKDYIEKRNKAQLEKQKKLAKKLTT